MLKAYRAVFRAPGSAAFATAGFVMRMPIAIYPIALVLIVSGRDGHYGFAGVVSACYVVGAVPGGPLLSRMVDRYGQRPLLLPATVAHLAAVVVLAVLVESDAPDWTLTIPTFVAGFAYLSVGSMIRARWSLVLAGKPELTTAYSVESILDELIFVCGPLIATVIATHADPVYVLYVALVLIVVGAAWLSTLRATEPPRHPVGAPRGRSAVRERGMPLLSLGTVFMGAVFASAEISMIAFCGQHGHRSLSGLVVAMFAAGSGMAGFFYGARTWQASMLTRYRLQATIFAVLPFAFLLAANVGMLAACSFVVGLGIAPALITTFGLVEQLVPGASLTEGLTWVTTGLSVGYGAGAAVVGGIADAHGARTAFSVTVVAALLTATVAGLLHRQLRASDHLRPTSVGSSEHAPLS